MFSTVDRKLFVIIECYGCQYSLIVLYLNEKMDIRSQSNVHFFKRYKALLPAIYFPISLDISFLRYPDFHPIWLVILGRYLLRRKPEKNILADLKP